MRTYCDTFQFRCSGTRCPGNRRISINAPRCVRCAAPPPPHLAPMVHAFQTCMCDMCAVLRQVLVAARVLRGTRLHEPVNISICGPRTQDRRSLVSATDVPRATIGSSNSRGSRCGHDLRWRHSHAWPMPDGDSPEAYFKLRPGYCTYVSIPGIV